MKRKIMTVLQAMVMLFAMTAASGCFVGGGHWDGGHGNGGQGDWHHH